MNFKRNFIYIVAACSLGLASCKKFLDLQPVDKILEESVYKDEKMAQMALNGIYLKMAKPALYGSNMTLKTTDILGQYYNLASGHMYSRLYTYDYKDLNVQREFETIWDAAYQSILNINNFIRNLQNAPAIMTPARQQLMKGEAIGLRAYIHFDMLRLFGPVYTMDAQRESIPYVTQASAKTSSLLPARQVLDSVLKDIDAAALLLEADPVRQDGVKAMDDVAQDNFYRMRNRRFNYYALMTLKSRVLLYRGDRAEAYRVAKSVLEKVDGFFPWIDPSKVNSSPQAPDRIFSSEVLFGIQNDQLYNSHDSLFNPSLLSNLILLPSRANLDKNFENNSSDYRYLSWATPTIGNYEKVLIKFQDVQNKAAAFRFFQPLVRKSELYLILGESTTDPNEALILLNTLRKNRGLAAMDKITDLRNVLDAEYRKEFYGEGQIFFYNKRMAKTSVPNPANASTKSIALSAYSIPLPLSETNNR